MFKAPKPTCWHMADDCSSRNILLYFSDVDVRPFVRPVVHSLLLLCYASQTLQGYHCDTNYNGYLSFIVQLVSKYSLHLTSLQLSSQIKIYIDSHKESFWFNSPML